MYDVESVRKEFPILHREVYGKPLVYLDNGASAQKPLAVIETINRVYREEYANVHRGLHFLSNTATEAYEGVRGKIAKFVGATHEEEIVYVRSSTEAINLVAYSWLEPRVQPGDEIVLSVMEHHANIVPWHFMRERHGAVLKWVEIDSDGNLDFDSLQDAMSERTRLVAVTHMSNVLGTIIDISRVTEVAHAQGVPVLVDGSQGAVHCPLDLSEVDVDFYCLTGHKLYGPTGSGALFARREHLSEMQPFLGGGDMIREVRREGISYADPPLRFEAGTPNIVQMIGLGSAIDFLEHLGLDAISEHEETLRDYAAEQLGQCEWLFLHGHAKNRGSIFSFNIRDAHPHDVSTVIDRRGVAVRAGHHCAQPLMEHLGTTATCRASFGLYNTRAEIDALVDALEAAHRILV